MTPLSPEKRSLRLRLGIGVVLVGTTSFVSGAATGFSVHPQSDAVHPDASVAGPVSSAAARTASTSGECVTPSHTWMVEAPAAQTLAAPVEAAPASGLHASGAAPGDESDASGGAGVDADDAEPAPRWMIQVGAFSDDDNAQALASRLESKGYEPLIVAARSRSGDWLQHVRLDFAGDENTAVARAREFEQTEGLPVVVVAIGPDGERLH